MDRISLRRALILAGLAVVVVAGTASATSARPTRDAVRTAAKDEPCPPYNSVKSILNARPLAADLDPKTAMPPINKMPSTSAALGTKQKLRPAWYTDLRVTPAQQKAICAKHLSAVYIDWDSVPFNQAIRWGHKDVYRALGIKVLRIVNYSFAPSGFTGALAAVLPLHPDIISAGGAISPETFGAIMNPAVKQGVTVTTWGLGAKNWNTGPGQPLTALVGYDFYHLGTQLADAIHKAYPKGVNFGYIHWVNDSLAIHNREQGMLDELKKYKNIHIITNGTPSPSNAASGFTDFNASTAFTVAWLKAHPTVQLLFAPWEDPPALGEAAAIKTLHLENKVHIATMDLGTAGAYQLAHKGIISVDMAQGMYDGGRSMALAAALSKIGALKHPYIIVPTVAATAKNVLDAWNFMHGPDMPCGSSCKK
jgi:ribose transport system substrate-binding protein